MGQNEGCYSVARIFLSALFFVQWSSLSRCQSCGGSGEPCFFVLIAEQAAQVLPLPSGEGVLPYKSALNDCLCCASKYRLSNTRFFFFFRIRRPAFYEEFNEYLLILFYFRV